MKKLISLLLALVMVFALATVAFADEIWPKPNQNASFGKTYITTNPLTQWPAETFTFKFTAESLTESNANLGVADMPPIPDATIDFANNDALDRNGVMQNVNVALSNVVWPGVGVYIYDVYEVEGKTPGVTYDKDHLKLKVTVAYDQGTDTYYTAFVTMNLDDRDEDGITDVKTGGFQNEYSAGSLQVTKQVSGNMASTTDYFKVTVTLTAAADKNDNYHETYKVTGGTKIEDGKTDCNVSTISVGTSKEFWLKHGETITITNLPYYVTYSVVEDDYTTEDMGGYDDPAYTFSDGEKKIDSVLDTVLIVNSKSVGVDTGVVLDSMPYVLLLAVAVIGMFAMVSKKRSYEN